MRPFWPASVRRCAGFAGLMTPLPPSVEAIAALLMRPKYPLSDEPKSPPPTKRLPAVSKARASPESTLPTSVPCVLKFRGEGAVRTDASKALIAPVAVGEPPLAVPLPV